MSWLLQEDGFRLMLEDASGALLLEAVDVTPPYEMVLQGGDDAPRRKRKWRDELFDEMEQTMRAHLHPPLVETVEAGAAPRVVPDPVPALDEELQTLLKLAGESHQLLQRAQRIKEEYAALQREYREAADRDDEETLLWMS